MSGRTEHPQISELFYLLRRIRGYDWKDFDDARSFIMNHVQCHMSNRKRDMSSQSDNGNCFSCNRPFGSQTVVSHPLWMDDKICDDCRRLPRCISCERRAGTRPFFLLSSLELAAYFRRQVGCQSNRIPLYVCAECTASGTTSTMKEVNNVIQSALQFMKQSPYINIDFSTFKMFFHASIKNDNIQTLIENNRIQVPVRAVDIHLLSRPSTDTTVTSQNHHSGRSWGEHLVFGRCECIEYGQSSLIPANMNRKRLEALKSHHGLIDNSSTPASKALKKKQDLLLSEYRGRMATCSNFIQRARPQNQLNNEKEFNNGFSLLKQTRSELSTERRIPVSDVLKPTNHRKVFVDDNNTSQVCIPAVSKFEDIENNVYSNKNISLYNSNYRQNNLKVDCNNKTINGSTYRHSSLTCNRNKIPPHQLSNQRTMSNRRSSSSSSSSNINCSKRDNNNNYRTGSRLNFFTPLKRCNDTAEDDQKHHQYNLTPIAASNLKMSPRYTWYAHPNTNESSSNGINLIDKQHFTSSLQRSHSMHHNSHNSVESTHNFKITQSPDSGTTTLRSSSVHPDSAALLTASYNQHHSSLTRDNKFEKNSGLRNVNIITNNDNSSNEVFQNKNKYQNELPNTHSQASTNSINNKNNHLQQQRPIIYSDSCFKKNRNYDVPSNNNVNVIECNLNKRNISKIREPYFIDVCRIPLPTNTTKYCDDNNNKVVDGSSPQSLINGKDKENKILIDTHCISHDSSNSFKPRRLAASASLSSGFLRRNSIIKSKLICNETNQISIESSDNNRSSSPSNQDRSYPSFLSKRYTSEQNSELIRNFPAPSVCRSTGLINSTEFALTSSRVSPYNTTNAIAATISNEENNNYPSCAYSYNVIHKTNFVPDNNNNILMYTLKAKHAYIPPPLSQSENRYSDHLTTLLPSFTDEVNLNGFKCFSKTANLKKKRRLKSILVAAGLPSDIFSSTLTHELTHAYLFAAGYRLPLIVEEGICNATCLFDLLTKIINYNALITRLSTKLQEIITEPPQPNRPSEILFASEYRFYKGMLEELFPNEFSYYFLQSEGLKPSDSNNLQFNLSTLSSKTLLCLLRERIILRHRTCVYRFQRMLYGDTPEYAAAVAFLPLLFYMDLKSIIIKLQKYYPAS